MKPRGRPSSRRGRLVRVRLASNWIVCNASVVSSAATQYLPEDGDRLARVSSGSVLQDAEQSELFPTLKTVIRSD